LSTPEAKIPVITITRNYLFLRSFRRASTLHLLLLTLSRFLSKCGIFKGSSLVALFNFQGAVCVALSRGDLFILPHSA
ncbi:MAG: hypothetical protein IKG82_12225, partial [Oscillospiraceae bacterium]|nr:hypothetical protein [Oscillospiraceae bacterium]